MRVAERILGLHASLRTANTELERRVCERTAELQTALHAKDEFLSRASHELRAPMNHVLGFAQLLKRDALDNNQAEKVEHIITSGQHLLQLIDRVLAVSKSQTDDLAATAQNSAPAETSRHEPPASVERDFLIFPLLWKIRLP